MTVHGGKFSAVNGKRSIRQWSVNDAHTPAKGVASNTLNGTMRRPGVQDWTGSYNAFGAQPEVLPGESFSFVGYTAPDNDVSGVGRTYVGTALVESIVISWNYQNGELLSHVVNFGGDLALTSGSATVTDTSDPDALPVCGTKLEYDFSDDNYVELDNILSMQLTISSALQTYVNSSTACWTGRKAGPLDWTLAITQQDNVRASIFDKGDRVRLKLFVDDTLFWSLIWGQVRDFTGITADRETGAILQRTINIDMDAWDGADIGQIIKPDTTVWFPPA